ncbi:MAG: orotate phosphoribosyltransferase [Candidatus Omnitrophica bacterium]|nr:orotate phosphoribosyltransferase [Candidatus Omnitrophota bacterium]
MDNKKIYCILEKTGALKKGHFKLSSGLHSEWYIQCALVLQNPKDAEFLGKALAEKVKGLKIDAVISPAVGGIVIGQEVARALNVRAIFAERVDGKFTLRRGFSIDPGEKILVVEDVVTTGGSSIDVGNMVKSMDGHVAAYAAICDRSGGKVNFESFFYTLLQIDFKNYKPEECPLCLKNLPLYTPGSKFKAG